ncbi:MAG: division/cell wall cluster transcriptional repressor MraZ [Candidatus Dormiibacterota bacterium]
MFVGQYRHSIDAKGRLAIPAKHREQLPTGSIMTIAPENCLRVYPPQEWERVSGEMRLGAASDPMETNLARRMFSQAHEIEFDKQGRVLIPAWLREAAGLGASAQVIGVANVVEIWSDANWTAFVEQTGDFTGLANAVAEKRQGSPGNP